MSEEGCLSRIELYKKTNNKVLLEKEEEFYADNYSKKPKVSEETKEEKKEKVKKNKD